MSNSRQRATAISIAVIIATTLTVAVAGPASAATTVLYASPSGTANTTCSITNQCTLTAARDKVRTLNAGMTGDIDVQLATGTYDVRSTFSLVQNSTTSDSGHNGHYVIYEAAPGASPVFSGGADISGSWTNFNMTKNIWRRPVPPTLDTRQLFVNGVRAVRARDTNVSGFGLLGSGGSRGFTAPTSGLFSTMSTWGNSTDIEFVGFSNWATQRCGVTSISGSNVTLDSPCRDFRYNTNLSWVENALELLDSPGEFYLDRAGDYMYYKPRAGEVMSTATVIAPTAQTLMSLTGASGNPLQAVIFSGISFAYSTWLGPETTRGYVEGQSNFYWNFASTSSAGYTGTGIDTDSIAGAVTTQYVSDITFVQNRFEKLGAAGFVAGLGSQYVTMLGNRVSDVSGNGFQFGGSALVADFHHPSNPSTMKLTHIRIENNYVTDVGVDYRGADGIFVGTVDTANIANNEIAYVPYTGIDVGWNFGRLDVGGSLGYTTDTYARAYTVVNNFIHDYMYPSNDGGAIYMNGNAPSSVVHDNYVYNGLNDTAALYLDNGTSYFDVYSNVVRYQYNGASNWWAFTQNANPTYGILAATNNSVRNNYTDTSSVNVNTSNSNTLTGTTLISNTAVPAGAMSIIGSARIQAAYNTAIPTVVSAMDDFAGYGTGYSLDGIWRGVDFGTGHYLGDDGTSPPVLRNYAYFAAGSTTSDTFALPVGRVLSSITIEGTGTYSLSNGTTTVSGTLAGYGTPNVISTGWTGGSNVVTITLSAGWNSVFDNITYIPV